MPRGTGQARDDPHHSLQQPRRDPLHARISLPGLLYHLGHDSRRGEAACREEEPLVCVRHRGAQRGVGHRQPRALDQGAALRRPHRLLRRRGRVHGPDGGGGARGRSHRVGAKRPRAARQELGARLRVRQDTEPAGVPVRGLLRDGRGQRDFARLRRDHEQGLRPGVPRLHELPQLQELRFQLGECGLLALVHARVALPQQRAHVAGDELCHLGIRLARLGLHHPRDARLDVLLTTSGSAMPRPSSSTSSQRTSRRRGRSA